MSKRRIATRRVTEIARRLTSRRRKERMAGSHRFDRGFVCAFVRGRWRGGWYETCFGTVNLACGSVSACAQRVQGLPSRFEALYLLHRLAKSPQS
ncbi:MAG TPA: hypothetical protein VFC24_02045 [Casimicrobiaceae bacterium]|nr:hypothetical protein [Casimicrobiaceae bacterium]